MKSVLVIEDDPVLTALMKKHFAKEISIDFNYVFTYHDCVELIQKRSFDLYILDLNLDGHSGLEVMRLLQKERSITNRVIVMSASQDEQSQINAYNLGASNFMQKPLNFNILRSILRKNLRSVDEQNFGELVFEDIILNLEKRECILRASDKNRKIDLSLTEFNIIYELAKNEGRIVSKEDLSFLGKDQSASMSYKALEMHVSGLRKKLGENLIETKRGIGYIFSAKKAKM